MKGTGRKERIDRSLKARTDDIFALSGPAEALYLLAPRLIPLALLLVLILIAGPYHKKVILAAGIYGMLAVSWDLLASVGLISLGQAFFFGVGAYLAGGLNHYLGFPYWLSIPLATVLGGLISTLFLLPVLRLRGIYFAMITLVLPLMLVRVIEATRILGGTEGLSGLSPLPGPGWELFLGLAGFLAALFGVRRLMNSEYGLVLKAIHDDDRAVLGDGVNIYWFRTQALFLSALIGAFAGAFMTHVYVFVGMPAFALDYSILPIAAAVVGGTGTIAGPALGAFLLVPLSEALRSLGPVRIAFYGFFLVVFIVGLPEGIFPWLRRKYQQFERWKKVSHD